LRDTIGRQRKPKNVSIETPLSLDPTGPDVRNVLLKRGTRSHFPKDRDINLPEQGPLRSAPGYGVDRPAGRGARGPIPHPAASPRVARACLLAQLPPGWTSTAPASSRQRDQPRRRDAQRLS